MNQYRVHPFHIQTSEDHPILVTAQAVIKLVNDAFSRLLHRVRDEGATLLTEEMLAQRTADEGLPHEATRDFLLARGILRLLGRSDERISLVRIASTDEQWRSMLCSNITGVPVEASASFARHASTANGAAGHQLWALLLPRYSEERIAKFYTELSQVPDTSGLIAYFRFRTLCVSSVYSPAYGTPCHFCHVGWESRVKAAPGTGTASISALLRTFEGAGEHELPPPPLLAMDWPAACAFLANHIQQLAGVGTHKLLQEEITTRHEFDLQTFIRTRHVAVHWPGCDCQYREVRQP